MGGGAAGWRNVAIVYGLIGLVVNTISVLSVKEVPDEEEKVQTSAENCEMRNLFQHFEKAVRLTK